MAGHSRPKDGVASARLCPAIHVFANSKENVDARVKPGHDDGKSQHKPHGVIVIGEKSTNQLFGCTKPLIFGLKARGATSWAT
jgi:hypothetical protein